MNDLSVISMGEPIVGTPGVNPQDALEGYRKMVVGRRLDQQATNLAKQGYLTVYPSSRGQEACQVAAAMALGEKDWLFPTYRDTVAMIDRRQGIRGLHGEAGGLSHFQRDLADMG